jgi:hypothetical protein
MPIAAKPTAPAAAVEPAPIATSVIDPLVNLAARRHLVAEIRAALKPNAKDERLTVGSFLALLDDVAGKAS